MLSFTNIPTEPQSPDRWGVCFHGSFWRRRAHERAGREVPVRQWFDWHGETWFIPAVYLCDEGWVIDLCKQVAADAVRSFIDKWNLGADDDGRELTLAQRMCIDIENPLNADLSVQVQWGCQKMNGTHSCRASYIPFLAGDCKTAARLVEHYQLDPAFGWAFWRVSLPWATGPAPALRPFSIKLAQSPTELPGPSFSVSAAGEQVEIVHPINGVRHVLTVQSLEPQKIQARRQNLPDGYPDNFMLMWYTLAPDLPNDVFSVRDSQPGDTVACGASSDGASIGIIGGADGPTAIMIKDSSDHADVHIACSSMHCRPAASVVWQSIFREKLRPDITVEIAPHKES